MTLNKLLSSLFLVSGLAFAAVLRADVKESINETYPFAADGSIQISNINGDIDIIAWDKAEVSLHAEKRAKNDEDLKRITVKIDLQGGNKLVIKTEHEKSWSIFGGNIRGSVRYKLMVPAGVSLEEIDVVNSDITVEGVRGPVNLDTVNGRIRASGLAGDGNFDTVNGSIIASYDSTSSIRRVILDTVNGSCTLKLPANTSGTLRASSVNGNVSCDFPVKIEKSSRRTLRGTIGDGTPIDIRLESVNGSLKVASN